MAASLGAAARMVCFCLLAGVALAILTAVVVLPEYARLAQAEYEVAGWRAAVADKEAQIAANRRLQAALPADPVLAKRLAMNQHGLLPAEETVVVDAQHLKRPLPGVVRPMRHARPTPPSAWLTHTAQRLSKPPVRRGLLLLAAVAMIWALLLFSPREKRRNANK